jgi:hypothetical protein
MHTAKSLKKIYIYIKIILYFHITKKISKKKYVLACILTLITSLLKSRELGQISKIPKKIILFSFNIWGYDLIRKTYSGY